MTGPAEGKVPISIKLIVHGSEIPCQAYIHLKGFSRARVTHLDLEGFNARGNKITGGKAIGISDRLTIILSNDIEIDGLRTRKLVVKGISVLEEGEQAKCVVGIKNGGIFVGFESKVIKRLEEIARAKEGLLEH